MFVLTKLMQYLSGNCPVTTFSPSPASFPHRQPIQRDTAPQSQSPSAEQSAQADPSYEHDGSRRLASSSQVDPQLGFGHSCVCVCVCVRML